MFRVGYLCVALPSGRLYVLSFSTLKFYGRLSLFPFYLILSLSCWVVVSLSYSMTFGPTLYPPGMFGGVTLLLSCDFLSEDFFAAEFVMSDICCIPEFFDKCVYVGLFVANVWSLSPNALAASCTTSSCVGGAGFYFVPQVLCCSFTVILNDIWPHPLFSWNVWWGQPLTSCDLASEAFFAGSCMRCLYSNCFPVFGHVIAFTLVSNTSIPCINAFMSTSPVLS